MSDSAPLLAALRKEIKARGWHRKATGRILATWLLHLSLMFSGVWVFLTAEHWFVRACGLILSTYGSMGVATIAHTASHYAASDRRWVNEFLTYFGYPFFVGLSATYWRHKHLVVHHRAPNVIGVDDDINLSPWFALSQPEIEQSQGWRRWYYEKLQWLVFPCLLVVTGFFMQVSGLMFLSRQLCDSRLRRRIHLLDVMTLVLFFTVWVGLPMLFWTVTDVIGFYVLRISLMSYALFAVLAPAHYPAVAVRIDKRMQHTEHLWLQTATTVNFRTGWLGRLVCSGLENQIEHHLFPEISHVHYAKLSHLVAKLCNENGIPYRSYSWDYVLWQSWRVLITPPPVVTSPEALRAAVQSR